MQLKNPDSNLVRCYFCEVNNEGGGGGGSLLNFKKQDVKDYYTNNIFPIEYNYIPIFDCKLEQKSLRIQIIVKFLTHFTE